MNKCYKYCLVLLSVVLGVCWAYGCFSSSLNEIDGVINLRKVSEGEIMLRDLCDRIEITPLDNVTENKVPSPLGMYVTKDGYYILSKGFGILFYRRDGSLEETLNPGIQIRDFSIYQDRLLDILSDNEIWEFSLHDHSLLHRIVLDTDVTATKLARKDENVLILPAYKDGTDYMCEYFFDSKKFFASPGFMESIQTRSIVERMKLFRSGDELLALYPHSGQVWKYATFFTPYIILNFKKRSRDNIEFISAQVTEDKAYYSLQLNGESCLLIFNRSNRKYLFIKTTREGLSLPLGIVSGGANYVCCTSADISKYIDLTLLDQENTMAAEMAIREGKNVIIKYQLANRYH